MLTKYMAQYRDGWIEWRRGDVFNDPWVIRRVTIQLNLFRDRVINPDHTTYSISRGFPRGKHWKKPIKTFKQYKQSRKGRK